DLQGGVHRPAVLAGATAGASRRDQGPRARRRRGRAALHPVGPADLRSGGQPGRRAGDPAQRDRRGHGGGGGPGDARNRGAGAGGDRRADPLPHQGAARDQPDAAQSAEGAPRLQERADVVDAPPWAVTVSTNGHRSRAQVRESTCGTRREGDRAPRRESMKRLVMVLGIATFLPAFAAADERGTYVTMDRIGTDSDVGIDVAALLYNSGGPDFGLRENVHARYVDPSGFGVFGQFSIGHVFGNGQSETAATNPEIGGLYILKLEGADVGFRFGLGFPTAPKTLNGAVTNVL